MYDSAANYLQYYLLFAFLIAITSAGMTGGSSTMTTQAVGSSVAISASMRKGLSGLFADRVLTATGERGAKSSWIPTIRTETDVHRRGIIMKSILPSNNQLQHAKPNLSSISASDSTRGKSMSSSNTYDNMGKTEDDQSSSSSAGEGGRQFKVCLTHGPCHKKKLICPKKCKKPLNGVDLNHISTYTRCIFNCKKCIAHC